MFNSIQSCSNSSLLKDVQILVVDNDVDSGYLYKILLEIYGAQVTTVELIADATALLEHLDPDILICEARFFNEDAFSLIQRIKTAALDRGRTIPILVVSAYCLTKSVQKLLTMVEDYLLKPVDVDNFVDEVWNLVYLAKSTEKVNIQDWLVKHRCWAKHQVATV